MKIEPISVTELNKYMKDKVADDEYHGSKVMLISAASTYVASLATTLLQVLRLVLLVSGKNRD